MTVLHFVTLRGGGRGGRPLQGSWEQTGARPVQHSLLCLTGAHQVLPQGARETCAWVELGCTWSG